MKAKTGEILYKAHKIMTEVNYEGVSKTAREKAKRDARKLYKLIKEVDPVIYERLKAELD